MNLIRSVLNMKKFLFLFFFFCIFLNFNKAFSQINKIIVTGNSRVSTTTIENFLDKKEKKIDSVFIDELTKKIYNSDLFETVKINLKDNNLFIEVKENSIVNFFYINTEDEKSIEKYSNKLLLRENSIFSESKLKSDIISIQKYYKSEGYYKVNITPEIYKLDNNQVNVILNISKGKISRIKSINFVGNKFFSDSTLLGVISTKEYNWWKIFSFSALDENRVEYDAEQLKAFYKENGFYDIQVESISVIPIDDDFEITFSLNSGPRYKFGEIKIEGNILSSEDISEFFKENNKKIYNEFYNTKLIRKLLEDSERFIQRKKYINFDINITDSIDLTNNIIFLKIEITAVKKLRSVRNINIIGNEITTDAAILDNLTFSEGDYLINYKVKKSIDKIKSRGYFKDVNYTINDVSDLQSDIDINVKEQPTGNISAGVGFGNDSSFFQAEVTERNFIGKGLNLKASARLSTDKTTLDLSYTDPYFGYGTQELTAFTKIQSLYADKVGYDSRILSTGLITKYEIYEDIYLRPLVTLEYDNTDVKNNASFLIRRKAGTYFTNNLGYGLSLDKRDLESDTRSGFLLSFDQRITSPVSTVQSVRNTFYSVFYKQLLSDSFIGSASVKTENITGLTDKSVKLSDRIYTTGLDLKGFQSFAVGPFDSGNHVGANNLILLNFKSTFPNPMPKVMSTKTYFFYDVANIWGIDYSDTISDSSKIRSSTGIAADIRTPVGPISLVYSKVLSQESTDKTQKIFFNLGSSF